MRSREPNEFMVEESGLERTEDIIDVIEEAAQEALKRSQTHEIAAEMARKILRKIEMKKQLEDLYAGANDALEYQEVKMLGIFVVRDAEAEFSYDDPNGDFSIAKGDRYLDLHIPPLSKGARNRETVEESFSLITNYIDYHDLQPRYLMGVTYPRMAEFAHRRFGFDLSYPGPDSLPEEVVEGVRQVFDGLTEAGLNGKEFGLPVIAYKEMHPYGQN